MRLPVAPATATARLWLAAVASAAVIGGAYLLESHGRTWAAAGLVAAGVAAGAARFLASSRADRRYARVLEHEVATQTRSLVDSLAATADAERHLRMVMDAVPDAIAVLDRDGRVIDLNESAKRLLAAPPNAGAGRRSEEHTSELQSRGHLVCRLLLEKKKSTYDTFRQRIMDVGLTLYA